MRWNRSAWAAALVWLALAAPAVPAVPGAARADELRAADAWPAGFASPSETPPPGFVGPPEPLPREPAARPDPVADAVVRAWRLPAKSLAERTQRVQALALSLGMRDLDGPARALLLDEAGGPLLERGHGAVRLAPGLPAAHFALARAHLMEERAPAAAWSELRLGIASVPGHLDAWLWSRATALGVLATAAVATALWFLVLAAATALPRALRALARLPGRLPTVSRVALVAALVLLPAALGQGVFGIALALGALALAPGGTLRRASVAAALALLWVGLFPALDRAGTAVAAFGADPVLPAVFGAERGLPDRAMLARLAAAGPDRLDATGALALRARREGRLRDADRAFEPLLGRSEPRWLNNAANVRLLLGRSREAIDLYERAARHSDSPVVRVNLSQAYGSIVRLEEQELALKEAQSLGAEEATDLTNVLGQAPAATTLDLVADPRALAPRLDAPEAGRALAARWRAGLAPGALAAAPEVAGLALAIACLVGGGLAFALRGYGAAEVAGYYGGMARVLLEGDDPARRMERLVELRARRARLDRIQALASWLVPGAAGLLGRRPWLGLLATAWLAGAASVWVLRDGLVTDPLSLGAGPGLVAGAVAGALLALYAASTGLAMALRERG